MFLQRLWQRLNRPATGTRVRSTPRPRSRLTVERLEDRAVPASFTASTVAELIADINGANRTAEADTITLAPGKTFTLTAVNNGTTGLPSVAASGGPLTIVGNGDVIERSTTKKTPAFRLIEVAAGASLTLENLTLQGGYLIGGSYDDFYGVGAAQGAAVYNAGSLTMTGVTVQNNTAYGGDGGWMGGFAEGGGIYSRGALTVQGGTIRNNLAVGGQGGEGLDGGWAFGGGIYVGGTATLLGTTIIGNEARAGRKGPGATKDFAGEPSSHGSDGSAYGGGLSVGYGSLAYLDPFTMGHLTNNKASTAAPNIYGPCTLVS